MGEQIIYDDIFYCYGPIILPPAVLEHDVQEAEALADQDVQQVVTAVDQDVQELVTVADQDVMTDVNDVDQFVDDLAPLLP